MSSSATAAPNSSVTKTSKSALWNLVRKNGPSIQEQIDASHQKCRTDWKMSETIIAALFKNHRREIMRLKGEADDEEMADEDDNEDDTAEISESPLWECVQGTGTCFQEQLDASHDKCRAEWQIQESIIATELKSLRQELVLLKEKNARQEARLLHLEEKATEHDWNWKYFTEFRRSLKTNLSGLWTSDVVAIAKIISPQMRDGAVNHLHSFETKDFWRPDRTLRMLKLKEAAKGTGRSGGAQAPTAAFEKDF